MAKVSPRWQFVILLAALLFLWGGSSLVHSCRRAEIRAEADPVALPVYPADIEIDTTASLKIERDSIAAGKQKRSSVQAEKMGKHHEPVMRDFLDEEIPMHEHR